MKKLSNILFVSFAGLFVAAVAFAWTNPPGNPPACAPVCGGVFSSLSGAPTNSVIVDAIGNVGIGTTTPQARLELIGLGDSILKLSRDAGFSTVFRIGVDGAFVIRNQTDDVLTIKSGNVGIGTANPDGKLSIAGGGIVIGGTPQRGNWNSRVPLNNTITTVDSANNVGRYSSITIGRDGLPVISYYDATNTSLKVAKCANAVCVGGTITTVDSAGLVGSNCSIAIGIDGFPVISYYDATNTSLKAAKCGNAACTSVEIVTVDSVGMIGAFTSIAIGTDGFPVISYYDALNMNLKVAKCGNAACSGGNTITTVDSAGTVGMDSSITIGIDGLPVISYFDAAPNSNLKVAKCGNAACSNGNTIGTVDSAGTVGMYTSITIGVDGLPVISYYDSANDYLKVAKCGNRACTSGNTINAVAGAMAGANTSITIGTDGLPVIAYYGEYTEFPHLKVAKCGDAVCSNGNTIISVDPGGLADTSNSIAIGADGLPVISYFNAVNADLRVAKCGSDRCIPYWTRR